MNLVQGLRPRANALSKIISRRLLQYTNTFYNFSGELKGQLAEDKLVQYSTKNFGYENQDVLALGNITFTETKDVHFSDPIVIESDVVERWEDSIHNHKNVTAVEEVSHTFSKTTSFSDAVKFASESSLKAGIEVSYGAKVSAEVSEKITYETNRQIGGSTTQEDTVKRTITIPPNTSIDYTAIRTLDKQQRKVKASGAFNHNIKIVTYPSFMPYAVELEWASLDEFIAVGKGEASIQKALYNSFESMPLTDEEIKAITQPIGMVEFTVNYDDAIRQSLDID